MLNHVRLKILRTKIFRGVWLILENSENFMPQKFLAIRYNDHFHDDLQYQLHTEGGQGSLAQMPAYVYV